MSALVSVADGLWSIHHHEFGIGVMRIGTRTNVLRLADGTLALHSPGPLDEAHLAAIRALGTVSTVVVPNLMHTSFTARAVAAFPDARVVAVAGAAAKVPGLKVDEVFGETLPGCLRGVAEGMPLAGCPALGEQVLFLPASRTVVSVDLAFNLHGATGITRALMWLNAANDRFCVTRLARASFIKDAAAARASVARMADAWDIERIVVSHGDVVSVGGRASLRAAWADV